MKTILIAVMATTLSLLPACSDRTEQKNNSKPMAKVEVNVTEETGIIKTEAMFDALLASIKAGETRKNVMLVGKLDLGSNPKLDPSKLIIGKTAVNFGHDLDKVKYNGQNVLIKADIVHNAEGKTDAQLWGHMIVNVQHVEIVE